MSGCFIYALLIDDVIFYIGQTVRGKIEPEWYIGDYKRRTTRKVYRVVKEARRSGKNLGWCILEQCSEHELDDLERFWIGSIKLAGGALANMTDGGHGGRSISAETRKKLSFPGEKNPFYGKKHSAESRRKISEKKTGVSVGLGVPKPDGFGDAISARLLGKKHSVEHVQNVAKALGHPVLNRMTGEKFVSVRAATRHYGISTTRLRNLAAGRVHITGLELEFISK